MQSQISQPQNRIALRVIAVILIAFGVVVYITAVITGAIPKARQIDSVHLTLIVLALVVCAIILRPQIVDRLGRFEGLGFKVELLQRLQERQVEQAEKLYDVDMLIPLLFRDGERKHLSNLVRGTTRGYKSNSVLQEELRRLRSIGLLKSHFQRYVGDLPSDKTFDLADWVTLTDFGRRWAERLNTLEQAAAEAAKPNEETSNKA